ncbi:MAG TPA: acyl carrier protein [Thermoanaerobaculia bacterium]
MGTALELETRIKGVMAEVLDLDPGVIDDNFSRHEASSWDSLSHLRLVTALEEAFGVKLTMKDVEEMSRYGVIRERIAGRLQG